MKALWQMWEAGIDEESVRLINEYASTLEEEIALTGDSTGGGAVADIRRSKIRWLPTRAEGTSKILPMLSALFTQANNNAFGVDWHTLDEIQHTLYEAEDKGHYGFHHDIFLDAPVMKHRKLSMTVQLSDSEDYEGGDFQFHSSYAPIAPDPVALRKKGTVLIFPSFFLHRVTPVTKGERKSLVAWADGPLWK